MANIFLTCFQIEGESAKNTYHCLHKDVWSNSKKCLHNFKRKRLSPQVWLVNIIAGNCAKKYVLLGLTGRAVLFEFPHMTWQTPPHTSQNRVVIHSFTTLCSTHDCIQIVCLFLFFSFFKIFNSSMESIFF